MSRVSDLEATVRRQPSRALPARLLCSDARVACKSGRPGGAIPRVRAGRTGGWLPAGAPSLPLGRPGGALRAGLPAFVARRPPSLCRVRAVLPGVRGGRRGRRRSGRTAPPRGRPAWRGLGWRRRTAGAGSFPEAGGGVGTGCTLPAPNRHTTQEPSLGAGGREEAGPHFAPEGRTAGGRGADNREDWPEQEGGMGREARRLRTGTRGGGRRMGTGSRSVPSLRMEEPQAQLGFGK